MDRRLTAGALCGVALLVLGFVMSGCSRAVPQRTVADAGAARLPSAESAAAEWAWDLPQGFPAPLLPEENPLSEAKILLGRHLFYDTRLSGNGTFACASCHRQELAFTDGLGRARGATGAVHPRGSMSLANVAYNASFTWADPGVRSLEQQALVPMMNETPVELGVAGREQEILERFRDDPAYVRMFRDAFPADAVPVSMPNVARSLASFERTLISGNSPYDRLLYDDERDALGPAARRGMRLFFSERTHCSDCHAGFTLSGPIVFEEAPDIEPTFHNTGLYSIGGTGAYPPDNPGSRGVTGRVDDTGAFRAPTLRNIAVTSPYMHDGSLSTLGEVIDFYAAGGRVVTEGPLSGDGRSSPYKSDRITGFELTVEERADLIAFLESLTDEAFLTDSRFADPSRDSTLLGSAVPSRADEEAPRTP